MHENIEQFLCDWQQQINQCLDNCLQEVPSHYSPLAKPSHYAQSLLQAMRYSVLNGGKRIRPLLMIATAQAIGIKPEYEQDLYQLGCALEFVHSYSLIHDDLPAMDDDDLRRGKPSCHRAFDEATAILAGDALQAEAFYLITNTSFDDGHKVALIQTLSRASGREGMAGGQAIDLASVNKTISIEQLATMHLLKTGALIRASVIMGAQAANATQVQIQALDEFAKNIGLAFQVRDDILDIESDIKNLGKIPGADIALNKPTYPSLLGLDIAKQKADDLFKQAVTALQALSDNTQQLQELAQYVVNRKS